MALAESAASNDLETLWARMVEAVGRASPFTRSYLLEAHPVSFAKNILTIGFAPEFEDHIALVDNARNHTLLDIAPGLTRRELETAINEADKLGVLQANELPSLIAASPGRRGVKAIRKVLAEGSFHGTDSDLERRFLKLVNHLGLPRPETQAWVNGFRVDFWWPEFRLVVETDGLTYHRTPMQQARDRRRDQAHAAAGITTLRFTRAQVVYERHHVEATLSAVVARLRTVGDFGQR
jgi:very-short-patch-repair endonuclease